MTKTILDNPTVADIRARIARRITELRARSSTPDERGLALFADLDADFQFLADTTRARLLGTSLAWSDVDRTEAAWVRHANDDLALAGHALSEALCHTLGPGDERTQRVMAATLLNMGNVVKWEVAVTRGAPQNFAKLHSLLRAAMLAGCQRVPLKVRVDGRDVACTLESLYFRALLLARFSSGALNMKQIEILDAWMWMWMPVLQGVPGQPSEGALRVDLDSADGLRRGVRPDTGPSLYLSPGPIEEAYAAIIREFHAGRMVPAEGITTTFRIEEHVAVLDLVRRGMREIAHGHVARAERDEADIRVELHVGLGEIMGRGFMPAPPAPAALTLATHSGQRVEATRRECDDATSSLYERARRMVRIANVSETGFGIEGDERDCNSIAVGDVVGLRLDPDARLEICKVVRCVPAKGAGKIWVGVRRLSARARPIEVVQPSAASAQARDVTLLFVPGEDEGGRHDACLVTERAFSERVPLTAYVEDCLYTFRFNRPRDRGRGWVLAGFEILAATGGENNYAAG